MPQLPIARIPCEEVTGHCRRVAALASEVSSDLPLTASIRSALDVAALVHESWTPSRAPEDLAAEFPELSDFIQDAAAILSFGSRFPAPSPALPAEQLALAAEILDACNAFDEAVEFAAYERVAIPAAVASFHAEVAAGYRPEVRRALTLATAPDSAIHSPGRLPVMPKAALQLMRLSDETTSPAQLQSIAGSDPVLCGSLLNAANSARYCLREPVSRVVDAAARLGIPAARKVLLAASFAPLFASKPLQDLWRHSQSVAAAASEAASQVSFDTDIAWTAGLLHDIGRLVLKTGASASRIRLMRWVESGFPLAYAETLTYGKDHAEVGAELLRQWNLPAPISDAVACHHQPERSDSVLASLLFLSEEWSRQDSGDNPAESLSTDMRRLWAERKSGLTLAVLSQYRPDPQSLAIAC